MKDLFCFDFIGVLTFQVDYQGNVTLLTQGIYMTKCQIDVTHYPFDPQVRYSLTIQEWINPPDFQRCSLKFASWTTEITRLNLSIGENISLPLHWSCVNIIYVKRAHNVLSLLSQSQCSDPIWDLRSDIRNIQCPSSNPIQFVLTKSEHLQMFKSASISMLVSYDKDELLRCY